MTERITYWYKLPYKFHRYTVCVHPGWTAGDWCSETHRRNTLNSWTRGSWGKNMWGRRCGRRSSPGSAGPRLDNSEGTNQRWLTRWTSSAPRWGCSQSCSRTSTCHPPAQGHTDTALSSAATRSFSHTPSPPQPLTFLTALPWTHLHKGTGDGATPELIEQSFADGHIRNTGHPVCDDNDAWKHSGKHGDLTNSRFIYSQGHHLAPCQCFGMIRTIMQKWKRNANKIQK